MNVETKINHRLITYLFTPSWLSGLVCVCGGFIVTAVTILSLQYTGSGLEQYFKSYQATQYNQALADSYRTDTLHRLVSSAPLLVFWALVGLVVYLLASNVVVALQQANEMKHELDYVNSNRTRLLGTVFLHFVIRIGVVALWLPYIKLFFHDIVPYCLTASVASGLLTLDGALGAVLAIVVMALALHIHVFLLRILLLRPRVFSRALYVS